MDEMEIQQALSRLEKLYRQGHLSQELFESKKGQLLGQWSGPGPFPSNRVPSSHRPVTGNHQSFTPSAEKLLTRSAPVPDRPMRLDAHGIGKLVDRRTAEEIESINEPFSVAAMQHSSRPEEQGRLPSDALARAMQARGQELAAGADSSDSMVEEQPRIGDMLRGRYRLQKLLGSGGMGQVFLVHDERFGGLYAAKILHPWVVRHEPTISRFIQEFKIMEGLNHPGIVRTYMLDEEPAQHRLFYLMEYVEGMTLQHVLERALQNGGGPPFSGTETLAFLDKLTSVLEYTHRRRILHRDLKPTNIMLYQHERGYGLKLLDFGLAKWMTDAEDPAIHTGHAGTFFYIAPEQLMGGSAAMVAADVFSLGVILYQMLTGSLPVAMAIPPSEVNPELPRELDGVLRKAMHARWEHRQQSVRELLADFRSVLLGAGQEEHQLTPTPKKEPIPVAITSASVETVSVTEARTVTHPQAQEVHAAQEQRKPHIRASRPSTGGQEAFLPEVGPGMQTTKERQSVPRKTFPSKVPSGRRQQPSVHPAPISNAERIARLRQGGPHASPKPMDPKERGSSTRSQPPVRKPTSSHRSMPSRPPKPSSTQSRPASRRELPKRRTEEKPPVSEPPVSKPPVSKPPVSDVASPMPKKETGMRQQTGPLGQSTMAMVPPRPLRTIAGLDPAVGKMILSSDGRFAAGIGDEQEILIWDTASWFLLHRIPGPVRILDLAWSPRDTILAWSLADGKVLVWQRQTETVLHSFLHKSPVRVLSWSPNGVYLLCGCADGVVAQWDVRSGSAGPLLHTRQDTIGSLEIDVSGKLMASGGYAPVIKVWNTAQRSLLSEIALQEESELTALAFSPRRPVLLVGGASGHLSLWDMRNFAQQHVLRYHQSPVRGVVFAPDDAWLVSVAEDGGMVKWSAATGKIIQTLDGCFSSFRGVCVSPDGDWIATFDEEGTIKLWSATEEWNAQ